MAFQVMKQEVDKYFPRNGSCMFHRTRYARHRLIDAIRARHEAGESVAHLAVDYRYSRAAIGAAVNSIPDDNRMTFSEKRESDAMWRRFAKNPNAEEFAAK